jgi:6-phosphogluconolactonase
MKALFGFLLLLIMKFTAAQDNFLLIGTYNSAKSEGIYVYRFNSKDGSVQESGNIKTSNPSFLAISPDHRFAYAVNENADSTGKGGGLTSFSFNNQTGKLTLLNQQSSMGNNPCFIDVHPSGKWLAAGNYSTGNLVIYSLSADGSIGKISDTIQHKGHGINKARQEGPHVHATVFTSDNKLIVTDLGIDKVLVYPFDKEKGTLDRKNVYPVFGAPGYGPRHISLSPNNKFLYLMNELSSMVSVFRYNGGKLKPLQKETTIPDGYSGPAGSADIHVSPDGKFLYASNRAESNSIAIFSINRKTGKLKKIGHQATLGKTPRNFNFDPSGNYLLVANQNSDEIVIFRRDKKTGLLTDTGKRITVGKPVCIKWISLN